MKKNIRVLFVPSDNALHTGAFLCLVELIKILKIYYNVDAHVVLPYKGDGQILLEENQIPYTVVRSYTWTCSIQKSVKNVIQFIRAAIINPIAINKIKKIIDKFHPDIVHINTSWTYVGAIAAYQKKIPVVWHIREFLEEDQKRKFWNNKISYMIINKADRVIAISEAVKRKYEKYIDEKHLRLIYDGVDIKKYYNPDKTIFNSNDIMKFIIVGSLIPRKGHKELISACGKIRDLGFKNFKLIIVGKGPEEKNIKQQIKILDLDNNIYMEGFQTDTPKYYHESDVMFMVSSNEAFGRVTAEAMLGGVLVIGSRSGGTTELLSPNYGYLYEKGNIDDLVEKILYVVNHKEEAKITMEKGRNMALKIFSMERSATRVYDLYKEVLNFNN